MQKTAEKVIESILGFSYKTTTEIDLQDGINLVLGNDGFTFRREHKLGPRDRPDFFIDGGIAIECKIKGSVMALMRQVARYAVHDTVKSIIVVTSKRSHSNLPSEVDGKPVTVLWIGAM